MATSKIQASEYRYKYITGAITSNSSGLLNLTSELGVPITAKGVIICSLESNLKCSTPILWNSYYYAVLNDYNSATPKSNTSIQVGVGWYE